MDLNVKKTINDINSWVRQVFLRKIFSLSFFSSCLRTFDLVVQCPSKSSTASHQQAKKFAGKLLFFQLEKVFSKFSKFCLASGGSTVVGHLPHHPQGRRFESGRS